MEIVSVVAATYNRVKLLQKLLTALESQTYPKNAFEVFIIDDGSTDGTREFLTQFSSQTDLQFKAIFQENGGPASARNRGIEACSGALVVLTDDDCIPVPEWIASYVEFFRANPNIVGSGGPIERVEDTIMGQYVDECGILRHPVRGGQIDYLVTANAAYRTEVLRSVGGFDQTFKWPGGEDPDLSYRVRAEGGLLQTCEDAKVAHQHRDTIRGLYATFFSYGRGKAINDRASHAAEISVLSTFFRTLRGAVRRVIATQGGIKKKFLFGLYGLVRSVAFAKGIAYQKNLMNKVTSAK